MKKLMLLLLIIASGVSVTSCGKKEKKLSSKEQAAIKRGYNLPISKTQREKAKKDSKNAYEKKKADYEASKDTIGEVKTVLPSKRKKLEEFLKNSNRGKKGAIVLYQRNQEQMLIREEFSYDGKTMYYLYNNTSKNEKGQIVSGAFTKSRIKSWKYTKKGWFLYEFCQPKSTEEIDTRAMIRVKLWNQAYLKLAKKYINSIGYKGNNLFLTNWDRNHTKKLDLNGAYEYFYHIKFGKNLNHSQEDSGILDSDFESLMKQFLPVSTEQIRSQATKEADGSHYSWVELACGNYAPNAFGTGVAEVTKVKKKQNGVMIVTVEAVCEMLGDDALMTHEVTLQVQNGNVTYLGNKIIKGKENIPEYRKRI